MSRHLERLLQIDSLLRAARRQTTGTIAKALEVSERTVRKDLVFLRDRFSAPLEFNRQKGLHYIDPDWRLPSISLSQGELFALTLGARMLQAYSGSTYTPELRSAIADVHTVVESIHKNITAYFAPAWRQYFRFHSSSIFPQSIANVDKSTHNRLNSTRN